MRRRGTPNIAGTSRMSAMYSAKIRLATLAMPPTRDHRREAVALVRPGDGVARHLGRGQGGAQGRVGERPGDREDAHRGDRDQHRSPQHAAAAAHLGAEVEGEARAQEEQRDVGGPARQRPGRRVRRERARTRAGVLQDDGAEREHEPELDDGTHEHEPHDGPLGEDHGPDDDERRGDLDRGLMPPDARERLRGLVVDELGDRERQVEEVAQDPRRAVGERDPAPGGALDERVEAAGGRDLAREAPPDEHGRGEQRDAGER